MTTDILDILDAKVPGYEWEAKAEIESLRKQVAELTQEREIIADIADASIAMKEEQLAAMTRLWENEYRLRCEAQARIVELRAGMLNVANGCRIWGGEAERARKMLEHYLTTPDDSSALARRLQKASEPVAWGVDWSRDGDRSCCSIVKKHPDGTLEVVGIEYGPPAPAIPDDMVLVPREPTEAMIKAVMPKHYGVVEKYKAMIAVAEGVKK